MSHRTGASTVRETTHGSGVEIQHKKTCSIACFLPGYIRNQSGSYAANFTKRTLRSRLLAFSTEPPTAQQQCPISQMERLDQRVDGAVSNPFLNHSSLKLVKNSNMPNPPIYPHNHARSHQHKLENVLEDETGHKHRFDRPT